ncbi:MAG: chemotaxis-specific protein-glutamate methyltransferase CheB [Ignavibacteriales bacterium]|nr:chemotaxis-specific protein-glutamate methyltransferase CheB [Ignavibacteriales bacterium]
MIRLLIVEDSKVVQELLVHIFSYDPEIHIVGVANNGEEALEMVKEGKPDAITMDIHMPKLDGLSATRKIMETNPTPIIIVSSSFLPDEVTGTFRAMEAGALAILPRPYGVAHPDFRKNADELISMVKLMSEVKVVRRWSHYRKPVPDKIIAASLIPPILEVKRGKEKVQVIVIGASTGGPVVLQTILSNLGKDFSVPVLVVQHIAAGFLNGFVEWLSQTSGIPVNIAANRELILPGRVYIAPDEYHMGVNSSNQIVLSDDEPENNLRPSVSYLFRSAAKVFGHQAVGVLLSGMGKDGAFELKRMKELGAVTIAQDAESSVVHGMPGEAIKLEGATYILSPEKIAAALKTIVNNNFYNSNLDL